MTMTIKTATQYDISALNLLINSAYRGESSKKGWTTEADLLDGQRTDPERLKEMIDDEKARIELLMENEQILGCVYLEEHDDGLYLGMLTVNPEIQAQGLGKKLISHAEKVAKSLNLSAVKMNVIKGRDELIQFYERRGFHFNGKTSPFPHEDPRSGIARAKLEFLEMVKEV